MTAASSSTEPICHFFVYGTLKRGECREDCWPQRAVRITEATIRAALYDLGPYPAIAPGDDLVQGELWQLRPEHLEETLRVLDEIEGYAGQSNDLYHRRSVACHLADRDVAAWTYFYADVAELGRYHRITANAAGYCRWTPTR